ncbi:MAG: tyrosine-type recombinase/integrase, partial [Actinobacteria bacterium]|nr:tyrosine-type recombinase/integrase [Actinomycetota bacterium]
VDLRHGTVHVRAGKQHKQREVPLHDTTIVALRDYARMRDARFPAPSTPAFFISARGRRMGRGELNDTFPKLIREIGLEGRGARARPRAHDLRHYADGGVMRLVEPFGLVQASLGGDLVRITRAGRR